jgi:hypothetical protein
MLAGGLPPGMIVIPSTGSKQRAGTFRRLIIVLAYQATADIPKVCKKKELKMVSDFYTENRKMI